MLTNYRIFCLLLFLSIPSRADDERRECIYTTAYSQVGVVEATGHNDGVEIERYLRYVGLPKGNPYCSAGLCWTFAQSCVDNPHSALASSWFTKGHIIYDRRYQQSQPIRTGDLFGIYFAEMGGIHHVGMVVKWGNFVETIEFNSNDGGGRDGTGVFHRKRLAKQIYQVSDWIGN